MNNQTKVLQLTHCSQCIIWDIVSQLSPGSVATDPVIWGMLQHSITCFKTFTALKLHVCGTSKGDENQADRCPFQMKSTLVAFPE